MIKIENYTECTKIVLFFFFFFVKSVDAREKVAYNLVMKWVSK